MNVEEYLAIKAEQQKIIDASGKSMVASLIKKMFTETGISQCGWHQYTPYFNDGEPCVFGLGEVYYCPPERAPWDYGEDPDEDEEDQWWWDGLGDRGVTARMASGAKGWHEDPPNVERYKILHNFHQDLSSLEDELQVIFGDHAVVRAFMNDQGDVEFEVNEVDHD